MDILKELRDPSTRKKYLNYSDEELGHYLRTEERVSPWDGSTYTKLYFGQYNPFSTSGSGHSIRDLIRAYVFVYSGSEDVGLREFIVTEANLRTCFKLKVYGARRSEKFPGKITIYRNWEDFCRDREVAMKPGRALKHMFPDLDDKTIEVVVNKFRHKYGAKDYTLKVGREREDFRHAYNHDRAAYQDPKTTSSRKSLATSCMQHVEIFTNEDDSFSPTEVYASGDFHIVWAEDKDGLIAGRCVIYDGDKDRGPVAAPIYGVCENSLDKIQEYLDKLGCKAEAGKGMWVGAKLLRINHPDGGVVGPYSDMEQYADDYNANFLVVTEYSGEYEMSTTGGYMEDSNGYFCECCECRVHEDDTYTDGWGTVYCESCFDDRFVTDSNGEAIPVDEAVEVNGRTSHGYPHTEFVHESEGCYVFCEPTQDYWFDYNVTYSEKMDEYVPTHLVSEYPEYFEQEEDDEEEQQQEQQDKEAA